MSNTNPLEQVVQKVVKQHYVPRHYLSAWGRAGETEGRRLIWCKRKDWSGAKEVELMSVGQRKRMYAYPFLSAKEQTLLIQFIKSKSELLQPVLAHMYFPALFMPLYLRFLSGERSSQFLGQVRELLSAKLSDDMLYVKVLALIGTPMTLEGLDVESMRRDISTICDNGFEGWMTAMEEQFNPLLDRALTGDISFFTVRDLRQTFIYYVLIQLLRTIKFDKLVDEYEWKKYPDLQKMLRHGTAFEVAVMNASEWNRYELLLLENHSKLPFITGDQPLVNLDGNDDSPHFDIFYPISPVKAFLFLEKGRFKGVYTHLDDIDERTAHELNCRIRGVCVDQIYANASDVFDVGGYVL